MQDQICYDNYKNAADWLQSRTKHRPKVAIVCGSGLGHLANALESQDAFPYSDIPGFLECTAPGHAGQLVFGVLRGKSCVCMQGRFHMFEGHSLYKVTFPVRVFKLLGVETLIVTNAAGSLASSYKTGDIMIIRDHINIPGLGGFNPLNGPNDERFGPRFPVVGAAYDKGLRRLAWDLGKKLAISDHLQEGVYCMVGGPNFETIAEARLLQRLGVDAVGMSTVPEVLIASHCGMKVFGLSLITNKVAMDYEDQQVVTQEEVLAVSRKKSHTLQTIIMELVAQLGNTTA
ncbi:purine nucleoside phosphorylase 4a [Brienomyrus brachyistius]|uniref:purine nucleoside phosphorylase 4a n=1 Tax=Brienomyrus brachyistius TaxID=42636 RepID=UPI0020B29838|nr:purine nucleoside phosphorylase 4a [Brienomyrus brachyistius]